MKEWNSGHGDKRPNKWVLNSLRRKALNSYQVRTSINELLWVVTGTGNNALITVRRYWYRHMPTYTVNYDYTSLQ
jgi:hypothetical protein